MNRLLNLLNDPLLETVRVIAEQSNASGGFFHDGFVTVPNGLYEIATKETNQAFDSRL